MLAQEQQRNATLAELFDQRGQQIDQLRTEVQRLREQEGELRTALARVTAVQASVTAAGDSASSGGDAHADAGEGDAAGGAPEADGKRSNGQHGAEVASLRRALARELLRREAAETQLARLKEETSTPALVDAATAPADLAAANQEIVQLRSALADERTARQQLAEDFRALQERAAKQEPPPENAELRAQLEHLQAERQTLVDNFKRSLAASQKRASALEEELAMARAGAASSGADGNDGAADPKDASAIRTENETLRKRLDEEHHRTEQLASKLKMAMPVTDLIFKMQAQQAQAQPPPAR